MIARLRAWARRHTERDRYSPVGIAFHWTMAGLVALQLGLGWYAGMLPAGGDKLSAYRAHADIGLLILMLALFRMVWRIAVPGPVNDADVPGMQSRIAAATHYAFYACFIGLPLSGWAMWSALGENAPLTMGGLVPWPPLPLAELPIGLHWAIMDWAEDVHHLLVVTLAVLVPLHVAAALKHHFWNRHDVLSGMLPQIPDEELPAAARQHKPREV